MGVACGGHFAEVIPMPMTSVFGGIPVLRLHDDARFSPPLNAVKKIAVNGCFLQHRSRHIVLFSEISAIKEDR